MHIGLESLDLTPEQFSAAHSRIRELAYDKWCSTGRPADDDLRFWLEAEQEWIGRNYVPPRPLEAKPERSDGNAR